MKPTNIMRLCAIKSLLLNFAPRFSTTVHECILIFTLQYAEVHLQECRLGYEWYAMYKAHDVNTFGTYFDNLIVVNNSLQPD